MKIYLSPPTVDSQELTAVTTAIQSNWIAPLGPEVDAFEQSLATYTNTKSAAALSSGTAAIHLALRILNISQNDEVLCQSFTFAGTANPIAYQSATPVFIDSEPETWNMCPNYLEDAIKSRLKAGKKPKACIVVDLYGMPAKLDQISEICSRYEIPLIEDAAEALGASYNQKKLGSYGTMSILSFNGNKIITTSGGGALLSNDENLTKRARFLASQAREPYPYYQHEEVGFNYRLSNLLAALGRAQLKKLDNFVEKRRSNYESYKQILSDIEELVFVDEPENCISNRWLTTLLVNKSAKNIDHNKIRETLLSYSIESRPLWKPLHMQPCYKDALYFGAKVSESLFDKGICLPSGSNLKAEEISEITEIIRSLYK